MVFVTFFTRQEYPASPAGGGHRCGWDRKPHRDGGRVCGCGWDHKPHKGVVSRVGGIKNFTRGAKIWMFRLAFKGIGESTTSLQRFGSGSLFKV